MGVRGPRSGARGQVDVHAIFIKINKLCLIDWVSTEVCMPAKEG